MLDAAAVDFEFGFAGSARTDAAAEAREVGAGCRSNSTGDSAVAPARPAACPRGCARAERRRRESASFGRRSGPAMIFLQILSLTRPQVVENEQQVGVELLRCARRSRAPCRFRPASPDRRRRGAARCGRRRARRRLRASASNSASSGSIGCTESCGSRRRRRARSRGYFASGVKRSMSQRIPSLYCGPGRSMIAAGSTV